MMLPPLSFKAVDSVLSMSKIHIVLFNTMARMFRGVFSFVPEFLVQLVAFISF